MDHHSAIVDSFCDVHRSTYQGALLFLTNLWHLDIRTFGLNSPGYFSGKVRRSRMPC